jgi:hypothetical protein
MLDDPGMHDEESYQNALRRTKEERAFWDAHRARYMQEYPDEFVAVLDGKVLAHDEDLMSLMRKLKALGYELHEVLVEYMRTARRPFIL